MSKVWPDDYYIDDFGYEEDEELIDEIIELQRERFAADWARYEADAREYDGMEHRYHIRGTRLA